MLLDDEVQAILLCNASYLDWRNQRVFSSARPVTWCELVRRESGYHVASPERELITLQPASDNEEPLSIMTGNSERLGH